MKMIRVIKANKIEKLIESVKYGFFDEPELAIDFLNKMNVSTKGLYNEKGRIDEVVYDKLIEKAIRKNPEKAVENLGSLGEEIWYEDKEVKSAKNEQIKFKFPVVTNVQEVEDLLQEYNLTYNFKDANGPYPSLIVIGDKDEIIRFAKEVMTGDWENDEDAKEFVNKFIPELNKLINSKNIKSSEKWAVYLRGEKISPSFDSQNDAKEWAEENFEIDNDDISIQKDYDN